MPGEYDFWADVDVPQSLDDVIREMTIDEPVNPDPTEQDVLDQMDGGSDFMGASDGSTSRSALYGNTGYTGQAGSSGYGVGDLLKDGSALVKNNPGLMQTMLAGVAGAYKDKTAKEMSQAQIDYMKEQQDARNKSVGSYGKTIHGKSYKG